MSTALTELNVVQLTPRMRYRGELLVGVVLVGVACYPSAAQRASPRWAFAAIRQRTWLLGCAGAVLGFGQAATDVMYLAALAMLERPPSPAVALAADRGCVLHHRAIAARCWFSSWRPGEQQEHGASNVASCASITRYGPTWVRAMCLAAGVALVVDSFLHNHNLW